MRTDLAIEHSIAYLRWRWHILVTEAMICHQQFNLRDYSVRYDEMVWISSQIERIVAAIDELQSTLSFCSFEIENYDCTMRRGA